MVAVLWGTEPDEHDYPAAADYLALLATPGQVSEIMAALKKAPIVYKKAKDLLRASRLALLPVDNPHVAADLAKIKKGKSCHRSCSSAGSWPMMWRCRLPTATTGCAPAITPTKTPTSRSRSSRPATNGLWF
jgi:hypothetical protein